MHRLSLRVARPSHAQIRFRGQWHATPRTLALARAFTISSPQREKSSNGTPRPKVRWYQQFFPGGPRIPLDPDNDDADDETGEAKSLRQQINRLEKELQEFRRHGASASPFEPLIKSLPEEDRAKIRAALEQADHEDLDPSEVRTKAIQVLGRDVLDDPCFSDLNVPLALSPEKNKLLERFNKSLFYAAKDVSGTLQRTTLWQTYQRCKIQNLPFIDLIPEKAWDVLWATQVAAPAGAQGRAEHLRILAADMQESGKELDIDQRAIYIESLSDEGRPAEAIQQWRSYLQILGEAAYSSAAYQSLGVRLYVSQAIKQWQSERQIRGNPSSPTADQHLGIPIPSAQFNAEQIARRMLDTSDEEHIRARSRILIPVIEAWACVGDEDGIRKAWALYLRLRMLLGSEMNLNDYDKITTGFLRVGRTDVALAVFKDMMLTGETSMYQSDELYRKSLGLVGQLQGNSVDLSESTKISLTALTLLPKHFQNKFFFGSWLKKLIGMGNSDAAAMVVELMYERNVRPDAKHLNGIIGAWLRSGRDSDREKAEQMAWAMVHERLDFVARRRGHLVPRESSMRRLPERLARTVPSATIETFSILLQHYERRGLQDKTQLLREQLPLAEIQPNSYFMNHLLYAELRRGEHGKVWRTYGQMSRKVKPDLETYACLWDCEKSHLDRLTIHNSDAFPNPRRIMCDMISWYSKSDHGLRTKAREDFSKNLYDQIIRCFCLAKDVEGTLVALYTLKESFQFYPDPETSRMVTLQAASMGVGEQRKKSRRLRLLGNVQSKANIANMMKVLALVAQQRTTFLEQKGIKIEANDDRRQKEEHLYILSQFLRAILLRRQGNDEPMAEKRIEKAAWDMGVSGMRMVDPVIEVWKEDQRIS